MFGKKETFRRAALERLSSPERLDEMMRNTPPKGWLAASIVGGLLLLTLLWGFFGSIPNRVEGQGLLVPGGQTGSVDAIKPGVVTEIRVKPGRIVAAGEVVAILADPDAAKELDSLKRELSTLQDNDRKANLDEETTRSVSQAKYASAERTLHSQLDIQRGEFNKNDSQLKLLDSRGPGYGQLDKEKYRSARKAAADQINVLQNQLKENQAQQVKEEHQRNDERRKRRKNIDDKQHEIELKQLQLALELKAVNGGRVFDVLTSEGSTVITGDTIVRIEQIDAPLQAVVYVPATQGQSVKKKHEVQIAPSNVKKEEFGTIKGQVVDKNDYPSSEREIVTDIRNETLAAEFIKDGAPIKLLADPFRNESALQANPALSGYVWTSGDGPERKILSGTPCNVTVITGYGRPIDRAISWLKSTTGL